MEWKVCEKYETSPLCLEGPTNRYVQFISKLNRKHCRTSVEPLTSHINLQYMLHKVRRAKTTLCRRCGAEKETSVHILRECLAVEKVMLAVHSHRARSVKFSSVSYSRRGCASVTLYTLAVSSQSTREKNYQKSEATVGRDPRPFNLGIADC